MRRTGIAICLAMAMLAACGGSAEPSEPTESTAPPDTVVPGDTSATDAPVDTASEDAAPVDASRTLPEPATPPAEPFEIVFERCLGGAGVPFDDGISALLAPTTGVMAPGIPTAPAEPVAAYGPPGGIWWGVLVAADAQDRYFLGHQMPTSTTYSEWGRVIFLRGALSGWTEDGTITAADLPPEDQDQMESIAACTLAALESDDAVAIRATTPDASPEIELAGQLDGIECEGPDCQVIVNETNFTVPAGSAAGTIVGTARYTIQFPVLAGPTGCTNTLERTFTYEGTVDETPDGIRIRDAQNGLSDAFSGAATTATDPPWPGRVLATGTVDLVRTVTPEGCAEGSVLEDLPSNPLVGYYAPAEQVLAAVWTTGPGGSSYLWAFGDG